VLVQDQRYLGRSTVPQRQPTMADYAADAVALLDHVGWESCCVFGISFGGMVAQEFAVTWPERVERLALFCTSPGGAGGSSYPLHELAALAPAERAAISIVNLDTRFSTAWFETHPTDRAIFEMMAERAAATRTEEQRRGEAMQLEARRHHDAWARLGRITAPTFIGCGRYDGLAPPANSHAIRDPRPACGAARVRGRPPVRRAGPARTPRPGLVPDARLRAWAAGTIALLVGAALVLLLILSAVKDGAAGNVAVTTVFGQVPLDSPLGAQLPAAVRREDLPPDQHAEPRRRAQFQAITQDQANVYFTAMMVYSVLNESEDTIKTSRSSSSARRTSSPRSCAASRAALAGTWRRGARRRSSACAARSLPR
jgi:esterase/lipase